MFYFQFEKEYTHDAAALWFRENFMIPWVAIVIYVVVVHGGRYLMRSRTELRLKLALTLWNVFLTLLSWCMFARIVPVLVHHLIHHGLHYSVCDMAFGDGPSGVWVLVFSLSKIPEMVDTVFLVLRKRPVIFLHWYHHITVMIYSWHCYAYATPTGLWFQSMNVTVHSFMYFYYFLSSIGARPRWNILLTAGQILQMVVGSAVAFYAFYLEQAGQGCSNPANVRYGALLYLSYLALFAHFFYRAYLAPKPKRAKKD